MKTLFAFAALAVMATQFLNQASPAQSQAKQPQVVTYDEVLKLIKLEIKEEKILKLLDDSPTLFTLSQQQENELKEAGASDKVIAAIKSKVTMAAKLKPGDISTFIVILDCSGSMKDKDADGVTKWAAAQKAAIDLVQAIPNGRDLAFIVYGHNLDRGCLAVDVIMPLGDANTAKKTKLIAQIKKLQPVGHTPIARSLYLAGEELKKGKGLAKIVLITDGEETCHGDPEKVAATLAENKQLQGIDVIGLGLNKEESDKVAAIATKGRGKFYDAKTVKELEKAVNKVEEEVAPVQPKVEAVAPNVDPVAPKVEPVVADPALPNAARILIAALKDENAQVRATAADSLARFKSPVVVAALCEALQDKDGKVRRAAADSLAKIGDASATEALTRRIKDEVWIELPSGFFQYDPKDPPAYDGGGKDWGSKDHALTALKKIAPDKVGTALAEALKAKKVELRRWAAAMMASEKGDKAVAGLVAALGDADGQVRRAAAVSLGKIGDKSAAVLDALVNRVGDAVWVPRPGGFISYNPDDPPAYDDHETWGSKHHALATLKKLAPDRVEDALTLALTAKSPEVRKWATQMIAKGNDKP